MSTVLPTELRVSILCALYVVLHCLTNVLIILRNSPIVIRLCEVPEPNTYSGLDVQAGFCTLYSEHLPLLWASL